MKKLFYLFTTLLVLSCSKDDSGDPQPNPEPPVEVKQPIAVDDNFTAKEDEEFTFSGILDNDTLEDNARLSSISTETSEGGSVVNNRNGSFTYNPPADFVGNDTLQYTICGTTEDDNCDTATITITVEDAGSPVANDDQYYTVIGQSIIIATVGVNDEVLDEAVITSVEGSSNATVSLDSGEITYTPKSGFSGDDTFTYTLCDDDETPTCSTATVTVSVLEPVTFNIPSALQDYYSDLKITSEEGLNYSFVSEHVQDNHTTILTYSQRHDYLYDADEDLDNPDNVILMYTGESRYWEEYQSGSNPYSPQTFNTEHIFPQSLLETDDAVTDLHHLRTTDADINSERLNYEFVDGSGAYELVNGDGWYPGDEWKGDVARMVLYLNVRYGEDYDKVGSLDLFLEWNREDPVSAFELQRNNIIQSAQGNRNPFIDNPYLATMIWGGAAAENRWE